MPPPHIQKCVCNDAEPERGRARDDKCLPLPSKDGTLMLGGDVGDGEGSRAKAAVLVGYR